ncbi:MAG: site-specific integrase [Caecibacter massiliensis]|nr:site-specific integrase [Caecibacter massiliensis]
MRRDWGQGTRYFDAKRNRYVYECRYTDAGGTHKRKRIVSKSKKLLSQKIKDWQKHLQNGVYQAISSITVGQLAELWLAAIKTTVKPNTYNLYRGITTTYIVPAYGNQKISQLQSVQIQIWLNSLYHQPSVNTDFLSARTVNIIRNVWRTMMGYAVRNGMATINPLTKIKSIREDRQLPVALTEQQLAHLLAVAKSGDYYPGDDSVFTHYLNREAYVAVLLAARTGMRRGEVFGLDWSTVHLDQNLLIVRYTLLADRRRTSPKTKSSQRNILLDDDTIGILHRWKVYQAEYAAHYSGIYHNSQHLVFTTARGTPVSMDNFRQRHWNAMCKAAGIPGFSFHGLRHTHATLLLKAGVNVKVVAERLGHADVAITMRTYAHVLPTMQASAVEAINRISKGSDSNA